MQEQDKEIFQDYEIKNWNLSPRIYKIIGAAAAFHLLTLLVLGQTNLLTTKGCDSPFVSTVCQVLDTVYVGSALFGTDTTFDSRDYVKTELEDADITFVDVSGQTPPLKYPEGYFAIANPDEFAAMQNATTSDFSNFPTTIPGFSSNPTIGNETNLLAQPQVTPTPNKNAISGNIPDLPYSIGTNPVPPPTVKGGIKPSRTFPNRPPKIKNNNSSPKELPKLDGETAAENKENKKDEKTAEANQPPLNSEAVTEFKPNKKPLEDFADGILAKRADANSKLDLTKSFTVRMTGELDKDGKLDPKKSRYVKLKDEEQGDAEMVNVAKSAIEAVNNSGLFYYLKQVGVDKVDFTLVQNDKQIYAIIKSAQPDENKAKTVSSGFNTILGIAKLAVKEEELKTLLTSG
jgi:hypothetical protein